MQPADIIMNQMGFSDPVLGAEAGFEPFSQYDDEFKNDVTIASEVRKYMSLNQPELQNYFNPVVDEDSRQNYIDSNELRKRLFEAKWEWHKDRTLGQFKATTMEIEEEKSIAEDYDRWMKPRVEFMYNYLDFDNDYIVITLENDYDSFLRASRGQLRTPRRRRPLMRRRPQGRRVFIRG